MRRMATEDDTITFSFEDSPKQAESDPQPGKTRRTAKKSTSLPSTGRRKSEIERELEVNIFMITSMCGQLWSTKDEICGPVLVQQSSDIASALSELIAKKPELARKLLEATDFSQYMKLFFAVMPVVRAVGSHHIAPAREKVAQMREEQEGTNLSGNGSVPFPH